MTTRTYYLPRNQVSRYVMNRIIEKVGCSIDDVRPSRNTDTLRFSITCNTKDIVIVEKILKLYDMI